MDVDTNHFFIHHFIRDDVLRAPGNERVYMYSVSRFYACHRQFGLHSVLTVAPLESRNLGGGAKHEKHCVVSNAVYSSFIRAHPGGS